MTCRDEHTFVDDEPCSGCGLTREEVLYRNDAEAQARDERRELARMAQALDPDGEDDSDTDVRCGSCGWVHPDASRCRDENGEMIV